jgi:hypothetical protein
MGHGGRLEGEDSWSQSTGGIASRSRLYLRKSMLKKSPGRLDSPKEDSVMWVTFAWHSVVQFQTSHRDTSAKQLLCGRK